ncbi:hypothetical protein [Haloarchaeobius sp. TZWWS8]|uniref:hypothetical protein n=1 Tax=Haloarchaeobius sp. TZWWS8 TaxID=3446121 RepID=UPI003EB82316
MSSEEDDGYVHRPDDASGVHPASVERDFGWRGWVVVGVLIFCLLVVPIIVLVQPPFLPYWVALLAFPMLPALVLGAVAVWATTRP